MNRVRVRREHDDAGLRAPLADDPRRLGAVQNGHANVHEDHVRAALHCTAHGLAAVLGQGDDFHVGLRVDQIAQALGHDAVIVGDQNPDRHVSAVPAR